MQENYLHCSGEKQTIPLSLYYFGVDVLMDATLATVNKGNSPLEIVGIQPGAGR